MRRGATGCGAEGGLRSGASRTLREAPLRFGVLEVPAMLARLLMLCQALWCMSLPVFLLWPASSLLGSVKFQKRTWRTVAFG